MINVLIALTVSLLANYCERTTYSFPKDFAFTRRIAWNEEREIEFTISGLKKRFAWLYGFDTTTGRICRKIQNQVYSEVFSSSHPELYITYDYESTKLKLIKGNEIMQEYSIKTIIDRKFLCLDSNSFQICNDDYIAIYAQIYNKDPDGLWAEKIVAQPVLIIIDIKLKKLDIVEQSQCQFGASMSLDYNDKVVGFYNSSIYTYNPILKKMILLTTLPEVNQITDVKNRGDNYFLLLIEKSTSKKTMAIYDFGSNTLNIVDNDVESFFLGKDFIIYAKSTNNENEVEIIFTKDFSKKISIQKVKEPYGFFYYTASPSGRKIAIIKPLHGIDIYSMNNEDLKHE
ncbi:MAG: hypothetical protein LWY06_04260 [Firmicutes bacterium]|nr:hypothetical protein [Bacillota bacterium]